MVRYQVILAYDGTRYHGFQRQSKECTIQGEVEQALRRLNWQGESILAAGRTDTGVHASGQVVSFDLEWSHTVYDLLKALNANLPHDIVAKEVKPAHSEFHPRYDAISRRYRYRLYLQEFRDPFLERFAWRVRPKINTDQLQQAASHLSGKYDFSAFGTSPREGGSTIRTVIEANWRAESSYLVFDIVADAFLYHMVRRLVSFQVSLGQKKYNLDDLKRYIQKPSDTARSDIQMVQGLAPARGLSLVEVCFPSEIGGKKNDL
jgi:tRNA pseudouridine38-40 synthase